MRTIPPDGPAQLAHAYHEGGDWDAVHAVLRLVDSWRTPDPPDPAAVADEQMRAVDAHVRALVHAYQYGGLDPTARVALDPTRRRAVLTLYVRWIAAALALPCDHCGDAAAIEETP